MNSYKGEKKISFTPGNTQITAEMSVPALMRDLATKNPNRVAIERKAYFSGQWVGITFDQFIREIRQVACGLIAAGIKPGDNVAIMGHTSYDWVLFDYAIQFAGGHVIPIYETSSMEQAEFIISNANVVAAVVEDANTNNILQPLLKKVRCFKQLWNISKGAQGKLTAQGKDITDTLIDERIDQQKADDVWTIIFTSGTTGKPKGVELTHRNALHIALNGAGNAEVREIIGTKNARTLVFLPMAHVFARTINIAYFKIGTTVGYCSDARHLVEDMKSFKPTFVLAVPRVFEKIYNAADAKAGSGVTLRTFRTFARVAIEYSKALDTPEGPSAKLRAQHKLGDKLVYAKIREFTGGHLRYAISGGAPLGSRLGHFFRGAGITIFEGYGLTESTAPTTVNRIGNIRIGSVGQSYPGCQATIADDGELLLKGDHIFKRYYKNPKETAASFTAEGWFKTGDMGSIDADGYVWITGRKKELLVTAGGKNVVPAPLEDSLRGHPLISQVVVIGDNKPFVSALVTIDKEALPSWLANHGLEPMSISQAVSDPQIIAAIDRAVKRTNTHVSRAESIRKFAILPYDFTVDNGYLTPSLKVRRDKVIKDYANYINDIYRK